MKNLRSLLVDLKNGLPPRQIADRLHERGIVFVHVPKCAGTSVEEAIRRHYRVSRIIIDSEVSFGAARKMIDVELNDETRHQVLMKASEMRREMLHYNLSQGYKCISGHAPLGPNTIDNWSSSHDFVTVLREPVRRYVSHLAFNLDGGGGHGEIHENVETFLTRPRAKVMGSLFVKYFSGLPMDADFTSQDAIDAAKKTLEKMAAVGFVDQLGEFADDLTCLTGYKVMPQHKNRTANDRRQKLELTEQALENIHALCAADSEIYEWARKRFAAPASE